MWVILLDGWGGLDRSCCCSYSLGMNFRFHHQSPFLQVSLRFHASFQPHFLYQLSSTCFPPIFKLHHLQIQIQTGAAGNAAWQASAAAALAMGASLTSPTSAVPGLTAGGGGGGYAARLAARERERAERAAHTKDDRPPRDRDADKGRVSGRRLFCPEWMPFGSLMLDC